MFENIERITRPSREVFLREYVFKRKPVIITDLFDGQAIRQQLNSLEAGRRLLGETPVTIEEDEEEMLRQMVEGMITQELKPNEKVPGTVNGYLDLVAREPRTTKVCTKKATVEIPALSSLYQRPEYCEPEPGEPDQNEAKVWLGQAGHETHLHFDADFRQLFKYELWGHKRIILIPIESSKKLLPLRNHCALSPQGLTEKETEEFLRYTNAFQCVVRPGETIYMPSSIWHYFECLDTSMMITFRFRRNKYLRFLNQHFHVNYHLAAIAAKFVNENALDEKCLRAFAEIEAEFAKPFENPVEKGHHMARVFERIHGWLCTDAVQGEFARPFFKEFDAFNRNTDVLTDSLYPSPSEAA